MVRNCLPSRRHRRHGFSPWLERIPLKKKRQKKKKIKNLKKKKKEKEEATHSSIFAWKIPQTEEPDKLQSMGSQRVRHN